LGNLEEGSSTRDFERRLKGALWMGLISLKMPRGWGLTQVAPSLGTGTICSDSLRIQASLYIGAVKKQRGTSCLGGGSYTGVFDRRMEGSFTGED